MNARLAAIAVLLAGTGSRPMVAQGPTFSARTEMVRVDVLVTEKGQPVRGLRAADFEVLDNGVPQEVRLATFEQIPLNLVLVFDMSDSVAGERLERLQVAGRALLGGLKPEDQAALITFSHVVTLDSSLTKDVARVGMALGLAEPAGDTALVDASYAGIMLGESDVGRALVIVFSDGLDTSSWLSSEAVLDTARRTDAIVYGVSVSGPKATFLRDLTALTGGSLFEIESTTDLSAVFLRILDEFRHRYLVSYSPRGVSPGGWHRIDVRVKGRGMSVKARPGYLAGSS
jgi:Ca-activated chloride channel homolog